MESTSSKILAIIGSVILASLIAGVGGGIWIALISSNLLTTPSIPWAVPIMVIILWLLWRYLDGQWPPYRFSGWRKAHLRSRQVSRKVFVWALLAGVFSVIALAGYWIVLVELGGAGGNPSIPDYSKYPAYTVVSGLLMGSLVSPIVEEAAFRGYFQVTLEEYLSPAAAIAISSVLFALWHGPTQGFFLSKLLFYFTVGVAFGSVAYITNSTLPAIPAHILGDLTFFFLIWPYDSTRPNIWHDGTNAFFWVYVIQAILFTFLAILAFRQVMKTTGRRNDPRVTDA